MRISAQVCLSFTLIPALLCAQTASINPALPVKRVVLYKNGVGYFEHIGKVRGSQDVSVPFTSGQLNDVLKSLTVLDLNGGRITGVTYGSSAPVDRQLGELRLPAGESATLTQFLAGLRGAKVEVRNAATATPIVGRLLSVERKTRISGGTTLEVDYIALVTDGGEIRTTEVSPTFSVKLLESGLTGKVDRLLDLASGTREPDVRPMTVSTSGTGERSLFLSYISEVPVWKATYRIVIDGKTSKDPLLQGWAIVDNTVGQDWDNVELSLVAGAPQSFVQDISQPFYTRRPSVAVSGGLLMTPQTFESTLISGRAQIAGVVRDPTGSGVAGATVSAFDNAGVRVGATTAGPDGSFTLAGLAGGALRVQAEAPGFRASQIDVSAAGSGTTEANLNLAIGGVAETVTVSASTPGLQTSSASMSRDSSRALGSGAMLGGNYGMQKKAPPAVGHGYGAGTAGGVYTLASNIAAQTAAQELGDLFEYKLKEPITIRKNRSAMVPIVQAPVKADKVSVYNEGSRLQRPVRALWITNTSGSTLDGGSFSILEEDTFAGEGVFDPIRPMEKRLVSYAVDLAVNVSTKQGSEASPIYRIKIDKGTLTQYSEMREKKTYTFRNEDTVPRTLIIEHPVRPGYEFSSKLEPLETASSFHRFQTSVGAKTTGTLVVEESRPLTSTHALTNLTPGVVIALASGRTKNEKIEAELRSILQQKEVVATLENAAEALENRMAYIFEDQQRLRENLKSLKSTAEEKALVQRYTQQLNSQETELEKLKGEIAEAKKKEESAQAVLDKMISDLSLDERV